MGKEVAIMINQVKGGFVLQMFLFSGNNVKIYKPFISEYIKIKWQKI